MNNTLMNNSFFPEDIITNYSILIACSLILSCTLYYYIKSNNTAIPSNNTEVLTYEEQEAIFDEDRNITAISNENMDNFITDSDFDTDTTSDYQSTFDSESTSDTESILDDILDDPDLFFMPNVDFDVCPIEELKFFEFTSLYQRELIEHEITDEDVREFISWFSKEDLATNWINDLFLWVINLL